MTFSSGMKIGWLISISLFNKQAEMEGGMALSEPVSEKRNFKRVPMGCPANYQVMNTPIKKTGRCINISAGGVLLECDYRYPIGTKMNISVTPERSETPYFSAVMEVVRVKPAEGRAGFQLGGLLISEKHLDSLGVQWDV